MRLTYAMAAEALGTSKATISRRVNARVYPSGPVPGSRRNERWVDVPDEELEAARVRRAVDYGERQAAGTLLAFPSPGGSEPDQEDPAMSGLLALVSERMALLERRIVRHLNQQRRASFEDRVMALLETGNLDKDSHATLQALIAARTQWISLERQEGSSPH